ncbi:hypothetical protein Plhal703r1_c19g0085281 [Plasmopara halstedii]
MKVKTHRKQHLNKQKDYCILNTGTPQIGGTHLDYSYRKENYDKFFVKVRGEDAFVLQFDQLLCREHPFKCGERIMIKQPTPKSKPEVIVESKLTLNDLNRITKNTSLAKEFVEIPSLEQLLANYHGLSFECICRCRFQLGITEEGIKFFQIVFTSVKMDQRSRKISGKPPRGATTGRLVPGMSAASNTSAAGICTNGLFPVIQGVRIGTGIGTRGNSRR